MKKQNIVAAIGTLALVANVFLPGLAFGQGQTGTAEIECSATAPAFTVTPAATFDFSPLGTGTTIFTSVAGQQAYNNPDSAGLSNTSGTDYIQWDDQRDPQTLDCNNGVSLDLIVQDGADGDGCYFESAPTVSDDAFDGTCVGGDNYIDLHTTYVVSSSDNCPAGTTEGSDSDICYDNSAFCGAGDNVSPVACTTEGTAGANYDGNLFATLATYTVDGDQLGTFANVPSAVVMYNFPDGAELFGEAGLAVSYATDINAAQPVGIYELELLYSLTPSP